MSVGRPLFAIAVLAATFVALGCSTSPSDTYLLTGTVTLDGAPIPEGNLDFLIPKGERGPIASAAIKDGNYKVHLQKGDWRVQVNASREGKTTDPRRNRRERESYIPPRYNSRSILTVEVLPAKENHHDFALQTR